MRFTAGPKARSDDANTYYEKCVCIVMYSCGSSIKADQIRSAMKQNTRALRSTLWMYTDVHIAGDCSGDSDDVNDVNHSYMFDNPISS